MQPAESAAAEPVAAKTDWVLDLRDTVDQQLRRTPLKLNIDARNAPFRLARAHFHLC